MSDKKLYRVEVTFTYYAYTKSPRDAAYYASDAVSDMNLPDFAAVDEAVIPADGRLEDGWDLPCIPYGVKDDRTIADVIDEELVEKACQLRPALRDDIAEARAML